MRWARPHLSLVKKMPTDTPTGQSDGGSSSVEVLSSQVTRVCVKLTKTKQPVKVWWNKLIRIALDFRFHISLSLLLALLLSDLLTAYYSDE